MESAEHDYGKALAVDAEAIGKPGQRTFRLLVRSAEGSASVWMEKQQLEAIGLWLGETLQQLERDKPTNEPDEEPGDFLNTFDLEVRAGQVGLGYAEEANLFAIQAYDSQTAAEGGPPTFRCLLSRGQSRVLSRTIARVVAAGRRICPLCEMPMDPEGHVCPKSNGHALGVTG
jgi:uncharacterized repeat protein (TIGR03847 family)